MDALRVILTVWISPFRPPVFQTIFFWGRLPPSCSKITVFQIVTNNNRTIGETGDLVQQFAQKDCILLGIALMRAEEEGPAPFQKVHFWPINGVFLFQNANNSNLVAHLSTPWSNGWVALSFLFCLFVRPAMVTSSPPPLLLAPDPQTHTFSESLW